MSLNISATNKGSRTHARELLANTTNGSLNKHLVYKDEILELIQQSTQENSALETRLFNHTMKLTTPQIETIERYILSWDIRNQAIYYEILDHFISAYKLFFFRTRYYFLLFLKNNFQLLCHYNKNIY